MILPRLSQIFRPRFINIHNVLFLLATVGLVGCGGGGSSTTDLATESSKFACTTAISSGFSGDLHATYLPTVNNNVAVGGKGEVLGALVTVTRLADGKVLGSATTDNTLGLVTVASCSTDLPVLLTLSGQAGAQYYDEGTSKLTAFPVGTNLHALVDQFDENVGISFLTEGAYQYALNNMVPGASTSAAPSQQSSAIVSAANLAGLTLGQVQLANQKVLTAVNAVLPTTTQLVTLKSLPTSINSSSGTNALANDRYGIAEAVTGGWVIAATSAQPGATTPGLSLGLQLDADMNDGVINGLAIGGIPVASSSNAYYSAASLPNAILTGMVTLSNQFASSTILPLLLPTISTTLDPASINLGQSASLKWLVGNATSCTATGNWSGDQTLAGSSFLTPTATGSYTYGLTCTGPAGTSSGQATLTVVALSAPTSNVMLSPVSIFLGQSSTLSWSSTNSTSCTANGTWLGTQATTGSTVITPTEVGSYVYGLTCSGNGGSFSSQAILAVKNVAQTASSTSTSTTTTSSSTTSTTSSSTTSTTSTPPPTTTSSPTTTTPTTTTSSSTTTTTSSSTSSTTTGGGGGGEGGGGGGSGGGSGGSGGAGAGGGEGADCQKNPISCA